MRTKVKHLAANGADRREQGITGITVGDALVVVAVLLSVEIEDHRVGCVDGAFGPNGRVAHGQMSLGGAQFTKGGILETDRMITFGAVGVLARPEEEEVSHDEGIDDSPTTRGIRL